MLKHFINKLKMMNSTAHVRWISMVGKLKVGMWSADWLSCGKQTQSLGSGWHPPLPSGCICPCTGACLDSWSECFFLCSHWAPFQTSEVGTAPLDAETIIGEEGKGGKRRSMRHTRLCTNLSDPFLSSLQTKLQHSLPT